MLIEFEGYLETQLEINKHNFPRIIEYFIFSSKLPTLALADKNSIIQIFERICYIISNDEDLPSYLG